MNEIKYSSAELMIINAARLLRDGDAVFVGVGQPNLACNLAKRTHAPNLVMIYEAGVIGAEPARLQHAPESDLRPRSSCGYGGVGRAGPRTELHCGRRHSLLRSQTPHGAVEPGYRV